jgi:hypothetical protein
MAETLALKYEPLSGLASAKRNPKKHDLAEIRASIERWGLASIVAIVNEKTGLMVAGHGRVEVLRRMKDQGADAPGKVKLRKKDGEWLVPVLRGVAFDNEREAHAYLLADNRLVERGGWDRDELASLLQELDLGEDEVPGIGWSAGEVSNILDSIERDKRVEKTPEEKLDGFLDSAIRQLVLYFQAADYDTVLDQLDAIGAAEGVQNHTDTVMLLVGRYVEEHGIEVASDAQG